MTPQSKWMAWLYLAWGIVFLATSFARRERVARVSCYLGMAGFTLLGLNLFLPDNSLLRWLIRLLALGLLGFAAYLTISQRHETG